MTRWCVNSGKVAPALSIYVDGSPPYNMTATCHECNRVVLIYRFEIGDIVGNYRYEYAAHLS